MCVDLKTGKKECTCGEKCGKILSQEKQERYHEYINRMYRETEEKDA